MAQFGSWSFFPMHSCHSVSGSMCNECMLVGWLFGWTDGWMVGGYTFQCSECCIVYMESVCSSGQYIYTYILYSRKCIRNFCVRIEIYNNTLSSWARPTEEHHHHRHHWFSVFAVLWIVLVSLLKTNWNELVGWSFLIDVVVARTALKCCQNIFGSHQYKLHYSFISFWIVAIFFSNLQPPLITF